MPHLPLDFYLQDTIEVAQKLLGTVLVRQLPNGICLRAKIVETEAYLGAEDPACHSFGYRKTERTQVMYKSGGHSYVYFIYGMYECFNVVSSTQGEPEAVLIRAVEPLDGLKTMATLRQQARRSRPSGKAFVPISFNGAALVTLTNGPGKLCQALNIHRGLNGLPLSPGQPLWIESLKTTEITTDMESSPRIGIDACGDASHWPLRFYLKSSPYVSPYKKNK